jgi:hypothetical protein
MGAPTFHTVTWREIAGGVDVRIALVNPDGIGRGIVLVVEDRYLIQHTDGAEFVHRILRREELYDGESIRDPLRAQPSEGARLIVEERDRQMHEEGWTTEHDDQHIPGDLAVEAAALAVYGTDAELEDPLDRVGEKKRDAWGLVEKHRDNPVRMLVIAGALIAAEIDRMLRHGAKDEDDKEEEGDGGEA